jgi:gamma-glutamylputrescine oxidase
VTTTSYWLEEPREPHEPLAGPRASDPADVIVIGGGVTGCSCALTLAEHGVRVRVHEAREIAGGASGRNGGFALRGGALAYDQARAALGAHRARLLWQLTELTLERLEALAGDAFRRVGSLRLAADGAEREALARELEALSEDGFAAEWVDEPGPPLDRLFVGAILNPVDGALQPARWVRRLAELAREAGAEIVEHSPVDAGALETLAIVFAVDGLTAAALPQLERLVRPVRGQMLATEPLSERLYERPHYARGGFDYWQQLPDGRLVVGGRRDTSLEAESTAAETTTPSVQAQLDALTVDLLGWLPVVSHRWAGIWGETPDRLPLVGPLPGRDRVWVAGGYCGHGNVLGFACGDLVALDILGERRPELDLFDPSRTFPDFLPGDAAFDRP